MDRYDPQLGDFESFARATIAGEIRHHLRATVWPVHVSRSLQEHYRTVAIVRDELLQQCGHEPSIVAVADAAHLSIDQTSSAIALRRTCAPLPEGHQTAMAVEDDLGAVAARVDLTQAIRGLDPDELRLLDMRFYQGFTQAEIAQILDTNQVRVSRMLTRVLLRLRALLDRNTGAPG
jgi:RNA polymerase sigma-B factor